MFVSQSVCCWAWTSQWWSRSWSIISTGSRSPASHIDRYQVILSYYVHNILGTRLHCHMFEVPGYVVILCSRYQVMLSYYVLCTRLRFHIMFEVPGNVVILCTRYQVMLSYYVRGTRFHWHIMLEVPGYVVIYYIRGTWSLSYYVRGTRKLSLCNPGVLVLCPAGGAG